MNIGQITIEYFIFLQSYHDQFELLDNCLATKKIPAAPKARSPLTLCLLTHFFIASVTVTFSSYVTYGQTVFESTSSKKLLVGINAAKVKGMMKKNVAAPHSQVLSFVFEKAAKAAPDPKMTRMGMVALPKLYILAHCPN